MCTCTCHRNPLRDRRRSIAPFDRGRNAHEQHDGRDGTSEPRTHRTDRSLAPNCRSARPISSCRRHGAGNIGCSAWAVMQRESRPIAGDYPERYQAVSRLPRHSRDHLRRAHIPGTISALSDRVVLRPFSIVVFCSLAAPTKDGNSMSRRAYGIFSFLFDVVMVIFTAGLWLIWIFVREMRMRR